MKRVAFPLALAVVLGVALGVLLRDTAQDYRDARVMLLIERASKDCARDGQVLAIEGTNPVCVRTVR